MLHKFISTNTTVKDTLNKYIFTLSGQSVESLRTFERQVKAFQNLHIQV